MMCRTTRTCQSLQKISCQSVLDQGLFILERGLGSRFVGCVCRWKSVVYDARRVRKMNNKMLNSDPFSYEFIIFNTVNTMNITALPKEET